MLSIYHFSYKWLCETTIAVATTIGQKTCKTW